MWIKSNIPVQKAYLNARNKTVIKSVWQYDYFICFRFYYFLMKSLYIILRFTKNAILRLSFSTVRMGLTLSPTFDAVWLKPIRVTVTIFNNRNFKIIKDETVVFSEFPCDFHQFLFSSTTFCNSTPLYNEFWVLSYHHTTNGSHLYASHLGSLSHYKSQWRCWRES